MPNTGWPQRLSHDGREVSLEDQVWGPLLGSNEMSNPSIGYVLERIRSLPDDDGLFERALPARAPPPSASAPRSPATSGRW